MKQLHWCRLKATKSEELNLGGFQHLLKPVQKLVHLEQIFDIFLQESLQWPLVNFLFHFLLIITSHFDARLCQTLLICQNKHLLLPTIIKGLMDNRRVRVNESLTNSIHDYLSNIKPVMSKKVSGINEKFFLLQQVYHNTNKSIKNTLSANPKKWSNTLKQFVDNSRQFVWVRRSTFLWRLR